MRVAKAQAEAKQIVEDLEIQLANLLGYVHDLERALNANDDLLVCGHHDCNKVIPKDWLCALCKAAPDYCI